MKVLVCEDDQLIREGLAEILEEEGYQVIEAINGNDSIEKFKSQTPDFVILDVMMPGISGYDVCREIRRENSKTPIMFLSAKSEELDRVLGLELGADDYMVKPFGIREVVSRIRAITRRVYAEDSSDSSNTEFEFGPVTVLPKELRAVCEGKTIELSLRDVKIIELMNKSPGIVLNRDTIFNKCWGMNYYQNSRTLDQHISKLRKKLGDDPKNPKLIETVHGVGYRHPKS